MKRLFFLFFVLFISFSFGQSKKEETKVESDGFFGLELPTNNASSTEVIVSDNTIYTKTRVEVHPEFPGGIEKFYAFVAKNYKMPDEKGLTGTMFVIFVVEKDGSLTDIKILKDIGYGTGKEAIGVLKLSPKWKPAELNGKKVRCSYSLPITLPNPQEVIYVK
jgi:protein TonB